MEHIKEVADYYSIQAENYHNKYYDSQSSSDPLIKPLVDILKTAFKRCDVLEIACGTGFWTKIVAEDANSVVATDVNPEMIAQAGKRLSHLDNISFRVSDALSLSGIKGKFNGAFSVLFWCHLPRQRVKEFLSGLCSKLKSGSPVVFIDQLADSDVDSHVTDEYGNKLAQRRISGKNFSLLKNIPEESQLLDDLKPFAENIQYNALSNGYWSVSWNTAK
ncbi:MAG: class I SAM-dependent methyltransferase [Candidatus Sabulitectum sp.]|nr:class I SAM-dependent methyltransferase [Candidatus Sabulitectum sp.]